MKNKNSISTSRKYRSVFIYMKDAFDPIGLFLYFCISVVCYGYKVFYFLTSIGTPQKSPYKYEVYKDSKSPTNETFIQYNHNGIPEEVSIPKVPISGNRYH